MPVDEPGWWYDAPHRLTGQLLRPAGWAYGLVAGRRQRRSPSYRSRLPVICVGNFTAGGTGKTPTVLLIAALLDELAERAIFLSRGYGGSNRGPHLVDTARDRADDVGDEPLLLARQCATWVARDRVAGARAIEAGLAAGQFDGSVIVMDDGLQNPSLAKDFALAVVDGNRGLGNGLVIPAGPLRAPLRDQLAATDAIIVNTGPTKTGPTKDRTGFADGLEHLCRCPILTAAVEPGRASDWISGTAVVGFAGIGNPGRFFQLIERLGGRLVARYSFADHQPLAEADATRLLADARHRDAVLVTTEKDMVRLAGAQGARAELRETARALPIRLVLGSDDRRRLREMIAAALLKRREA